MERKFRVGLACVVAAGLGLLFTQAGAQPPPQAKRGGQTMSQQAAKGQKPDPAMVKRGQYLVRTMGCGDCHTPMKFDQNAGMPVPDMARMLSGHPQGAPDPKGELGQGDQALFGPTFTSIKLPFGIVYVPNLTPSKTGLGDWTEQMFIQAMRTGKNLGMPNGRPILPPMPWMNLSQAKEEDLRAIWAYLRSIPPVDNPVPAPKVPPEAMQKIQKAYDMAMNAPHGMTPAGSAGGAASGPKK